MVDLPELRHQAWLWHTVANWSLAAVAIAEALAIGFELKRFHSVAWSRLFSRASVLSLCVLVYADFKETPLRDAVEHELESIAQAQRESTLRATEELTEATARHEREIKLARNSIARVLGIVGDASRRVSNLEARRERRARALVPDTAELMDRLDRELASSTARPPRALVARAPQRKSGT